MNQSRENYNHLPMILGVLLGLILLLICCFLGQQAWSKQAELTKSFETCMEQAPFRTIFETPRPEKVLSVEELENYFDEFDSIFNSTGLPPVWNGKKLVPWTEFHKDSIQIAKQCHKELGISNPQKQLKGTYAKPVWDPNSPIWNHLKTSASFNINKSKS